MPLCIICQEDFISGREDRWRTCVINTNLAMGFAVAPSFVRTTFSEASRQKAHDMIREIKNAFKGNY